MKVVANTTPIISLASIGRLDLLERLFGRVLIAEAVYRELKAKPSYGYAQVDCPFIEVRRWYSETVRRAVLERAGESGSA